jgi:hypothetical protein
MLWTGAVRKKTGYGNGISMYGRVFDPHILSCSIKNKTLDNTGLQVCHKCNNRLCINPGHLEFGSVKDNAADRVRNGMVGRKLTQDQADEIRHLYKTGNYSYLTLGKKYGVAEITIKKIVDNKTYVVRCDKT